MTFRGARGSDPIGDRGTHLEKIVMGSDPIHYRKVMTNRYHFPKGIQWNDMMM